MHRSIRQSEILSSIRSQALQPVLIRLPIRQEDIQSTSVPGVKQHQLWHTLTQLRLIQHSIPPQMVAKMLLYLFTGVVIFYAFLLLSAITLFNLFLLLILVFLFWKYLQWAAGELRAIRRKVLLKRMRKFLQSQNQRHYSTHLLRLQLYEQEHCIKILNLRFQI